MGTSSRYWILVLTYIDVKKEKKKKSLPIPALFTVFKLLTWLAFDIDMNPVWEGIVYSKVYLAKHIKESPSTAGGNVEIKQAEKHYCQWPFYYCLRIRWGRSQECYNVTMNFKVIKEIQLLLFCLDYLNVWNSVSNLCQLLVLVLDLLWTILFE